MTTVPSSAVAESTLAGIRSAAFALLAAALMLAAFGARDAAAQTPGVAISTKASSTEVFGTTMTAASDDNLSGFLRDPAFGRLGSETFTYKGASFTLDHLVHTGGSGEVQFTLDAGSAAPTYATAYRLCLDGTVEHSWANEAFTIFKHGGSTSFTEGQAVDVRLVEGTTCPSIYLVSSAVTDTAATLTIGGHTTGWWHKRTSPDPGLPSCTAVQSGTSAASLSNLDAGTAYTFKAYSDSVCTTELASETFKTAPAQVTGLAATAAASGDALDVTWSAAAGATGYEVHWQVSGEEFSLSAASGGDATTTSTSYTIPSLTSGTAYIVRVRATATGAPDGAWSAQATGTVPPPEIDVQGNGVSIPDGDTTPGTADHTDFGSVAVAGSGELTRTFTIKNTGAGVLALPGREPVTVGGNDAANFRVTAQPSSSVAATTGTTTFTMTFIPSAAKTHAATLSIANNDADEGPYDFAIQGTGTRPTVTVAADAPSVMEGSPAAFTVTAVPAPAVNISVSLTVAVTGEFGAVIGPQRVIIAGGATTATYSLDTINDDTDEPNGAVTVTLAASTVYDVGTASSASVTITDDDQRSVAWAGSFSEAAANDGAVGGSVTATLTGGQFSSGVVSGGHVAASNVPAGLTADFTRTSATVVTATLTGKADAHAGADDVSDLTVTFADGAFADGHAALVTGASKSDIAIIFDNPPLPIADLSLSSAAIDESGASNVSTVTASLDKATTGTVWVTVSATAVSPAVSRDFTLSGNKTLTIAAGTTSSTGTVTVTAQDNNVDAPDKKVTVKGKVTTTGPIVIDPRNVTLTIRDDEAAPSLALALAPPAIDESGATTASAVTASLSHPSSALTTVRVSASPVSPAAAADFMLSANRDLSIAAGETTSTGAVTVTARDNNADAADRTVTVSGRATNSQGVTGPTDATLTIRDDDLRTLDWTGGFTESAANDGTVLGSVTASPTSGRFSADAVSGGHAAASNVPAGLTARFQRVSAMAVTLTLTGQATAHADANDVHGLTVTFADAAFTDGGVGQAVGAVKADLAIDFLDPTPVLTDAGGNDRPEVRAFGAPSGTALEAVAAAPGPPPSGQRFLAGPVEVTFNPPLSGGQTARLCLALDGSPPEGTRVARFDNGQWHGFDTAVETIDGTRFACATVGATSPFAVLAPMSPTNPGNGGNPGGGGGGGGGGGSSAEVRIRDAEPAAEGSPLRFRVELGSPARRRLDLLASTSERTASDGPDYLGFSRRPVTVAPGQSEAWLEVPTARDADGGEGDETLTVTLSVAPGSAPASVVRPEARGTILDGPPPQTLVPLFLADAEARQGFVRVLDRGWSGGAVSVSAADDGGVAAADSTLRLSPRGAAHFNSRDLEAGNAAKGLEPGTGMPTEGHWRLRLTGADVAALAYARTGDGFVTPLGATVPAAADGSRFVGFFNPGSNHRQVSLLRLHNPGTEDARVNITGTDDEGISPGTPVRLAVPGGESVTLTARELEQGSAPSVNLDGALGDGRGKWRLSVSSDRPIEAMSLLESPSGHLANLSAGTAPRTETGDGTARTLVPLFPPASDPDRRQGFARVINRGSEPAEVRIEARDDVGTAYPAMTLDVGAGQAVNFNAHDLEQGAPGKGLAPGTGTGEGNWRLKVSAPSEVVVLAYLRHLNDGFVTGMNALAPLSGGAHRVDFLNPGGNHRQVSVLRLMNPGPEDAVATVTGTGDDGTAAGPVTVRIPAHRALEFTAAELESGQVTEGSPNPEAALDGALGDGDGKWRLRVASDSPIRVMGLLRSPTGHLANLSAGIEPWEEDGDP